MNHVPARRTSSVHVLLGIVIGGIALAILLELIAQFLPPYYNPVSQSESDLAVGPYGFLEAFNFFLRGVVYLIFIVAFVRIVPRHAQSRSGLILLGLAAVGKIVIAFFATDLTPRPETLHGTIHAIAALLSFLLGAIAQLLLARGLRRDPNMRPRPRGLVGLATLTLLWSLLVIGTVAVSAQIGVWGLLERVLTGLFFLWILIVAVGLWRHPSPAAAPTLRTVLQ